MAVMTSNIAAFVGTRHASSGFAFELFVLLGTKHTLYGNCSGDMCEICAAADTSPVPAAFLPTRRRFSPFPPANSAAIGEFLADVANLASTLVPSTIFVFD
jgi:hypothetical protein